MAGMIKASELKLGDRVRLHVVGGVQQFSDCIVKQLDSGNVHLFRPYGATADFSYTGGVICYVGIEEFSIPRNGEQVERLFSVELK